MRALPYLLVREAKNKLNELRRKPGKLILYLAVIGLLLYVVISSITSPAPMDDFQDRAWLVGVLLAFFLFTIATSIKLGLSTGTTLFTMPDVNLVFVSPISPQSILLYGVTRMMRTTLLSCIFIIFNTSTLRNFFDVRFGGVLIVFAAFVFASVVSQMLTLVIYKFTNSKPREKNIVKTVTTIIFSILAAVAAWYIFEAELDFLAGGLAFLQSPIVTYFPIAGWAAAGAVALISGQYVMGLLLFGLLILTGALLVGVIYIGKLDYYEDVLVTTETVFEKQRAVAEGQINMDVLSDKQVHIKATGVGGIGASTLFYRHVREAFRASRFGLWGISTPIFVVGAAAYSFFMMWTYPENDGFMFSLMTTMMGVQLFVTGIGRGIKDLYNHYIYMIPENPVNKIIWSNLEIVFKIAVQSILVFSVAGFISGEGVLTVALAFLTCTLFSFVVISVNYLYLRFTGTNLSVGILMIVYFATLIIVMLPGITAAVIGSVFIEGWSFYATMITLSIWELIAGLCCFALSKGILHNCDMPTAEQFG